MAFIRHAVAGWIKGIQPPSFLLRYDVNIEAFESKRKYIYCTFSMLKFTHLQELQMAESSGHFGDKYPKFFQNVVLKTGPNIS